jgi:microcin C transport system substrate-binding protein
MSRRSTLRQAARPLLAALVLAVAAGGAAGEPKRQHALSLTGAPKLGPDFKHFGWVNPDAPKGGTVRMWARGTFDTLNPFNIKGNKATGLGLVYDSLMSTSPDESSTEYCLLCAWVSHPDDFSSVTFSIRPEARFSDGKPVTPEDVMFSLAELKKHDPRSAQYYKNVVRAEKTGEREVTFHFDVKGNRELPQIMGQLSIVAKHYWTGKSASGEDRDLGKTTLEAPVGTGAYRVKSFEPGRAIEYERIKDWWAKDFPVARGMWNFDVVRFEYYRDQTPAFEAFKVGQIDFWRESSAKNWATSYDFDAVRTGLVKKEQLAIKGSAQMQAFAMNLRRKQFQDPRVRRAFILAFDFEWANKNLFYDQYARVRNYFNEEGLASSGLPQGQELAILETVRDGVPKEVFTTPYTVPANTSPEEVRKNLAEAARLLAEAGYKPQGGVMTNTKGEQLTAEFLLADAAFERVVQPYVATLKRLGIAATVRVLDVAQYQRREDDFDYDVIVETFAQSASPGNEQRYYWGSESADVKGSPNKLGLKSPAIDKLIDRVIFAKDRPELEAATRALDRVLLWGHYVVPQWYTPFDRIAAWDKFSRPATLPERSVAFQAVWWYDEAKAKALAEKRGKVN